MILKKLNRNASRFIWELFNTLNELIINIKQKYLFHSSQKRLFLFARLSSHLYLHAPAIRPMLPFKTLSPQPVSRNRCFISHLTEQKYIL